MKAISDWLFCKFKLIFARFSWAAEHVFYLHLLNILFMTSFGSAAHVRNKVFFSLSTHDTDVPFMTARDL